jgi:hypothetical protein
VPHDNAPCAEQGQVGNVGSDRHRALFRPGSVLSIQDCPAIHSMVDRGLYIVGGEVDESDTEPSNSSSFEEKKAARDVLIKTASSATFQRS